MPAQVFGAQAAVTYLNRAFANTSPANAVFNNQVTNATALLAPGADPSQPVNYTAFAKNFGSSYAGQTEAQLANLLMSNLGLLPNAALETALTDYIAANGKANVGVIALQLGSILAGLEADTTYGTAAVAWNNEVSNAFIYSSNSANTNASSGDQAVNQGQTFTLTAGLDNKTGTAGNDTFDGSLVNNNQLATLNSGDVLDGGAGTDTLFAVLNGGTVTPTMTGIESVTVVSTAATTVDLGASTGVTSFTSQGASGGALTVSAIGADTAISLSNSTQSAVLGYTGVTGTADARTVSVSNINNATGAGTSTSLSAAGVETLTLNVSGATNTVNLFNTSGTQQAATVKVTGSGALTLNGTNGAGTTIAGLASTTIDGSAATGALSLTGTGIAQTITGGAANDTIDGAGGGDVINAGAGNDRISFTTAANMNAATVNGGDGTDTLNITAVAGDAFADSDLSTTKLSNVEGLRVTDGGADGAFSITLAGNANTLGIVNVTAVDTAAGVGVTNITTVDLTSALYTKAATVATASGADVVSINMNTGGAHLINTAVANAVDTDIDRVNVTSGAASVRVTLDAAAVGNNSVNNTDATPALAVALQQQDASSVVSGNVVRVDDEGVDLRGATFNVNTGSSVGSFTQVYLGVQGDDTVTSSVTNAYINGGQGNDNITGGAGNDYLDGADGADVISGAGGNDTVLGGAGNDTITVSTGVVSVSGGAGNDTVTVTGLGSTDTISGGDGTDTLNITTTVTAGDLVGVTGFERIGLAAATVTLDVAQLGSSNAIEAVVIDHASAHVVSNAGAAFANLLVGTTGGSATFSRLINTAADTLNVAASTAGNKTVGLTLSSTSGTVTGEDTLNLAQGELTNAQNLTVTLAAAGARDLDTINVAGSQANTTITLANANAFDSGTARTVAVNATTLAGSGTFSFNDTGVAATNVAFNVTGASNQANSLTGGAGADTLTGGNLDDVLTGGLGADVITGGVGNDTYVAGVLGNNTETDGGTGANIDGIVINLGSTALTAAAISTASGTTMKLAGLGTSVASGSTAYLYANADNSLQASDNRDTLSGIENATGTGGTDYIVGSAGANSLVGGAGADTIVGGLGADTITGGAGDDTINLTETTAAADRVVFSGVTAALNGADTITGFVVANDQLDVGDLNNATVGTAITLDTTVALATQGTSIAVASGKTHVIGNVANAANIDTAAEVQTALTDGGLLDAVDVAASGTAYLIISGLDVTTTLYVYGVTMDGVADAGGWGAGDSIVLLGTITTDSTTLTTANLV